MEKQQIQRKVECALNSFIEDEKYLLKIDVNERTITHKLAIYIEKEFSGWDVDCEYNRHGEEKGQRKPAKQLRIPTKSINTNDTNAKTVFPDIIVHHRGKAENLLVIEIKKTTNNSSTANDFDLWKLWQFKTQLGYENALFLRLNCGNQTNVGITEFRWIEENDKNELNKIERRIFPHRN